MTTKSAAKKTTARKTTTAKKAAPAKPKATKPAPIDGQHRAALLEELASAGWTGPTSYTATAIRETLLPWVVAGCPAGNDGIPAGAMNHAHPSAKATSNPARAIARDLRAAIKEALDGGDADRVVGLAQSLRDTLA